MSRKLYLLALLIVGLHLGEVLVLGISPTGALIANSLQTVACAMAIVTAFGAHRRGRGLSRPFWLLIGLGLATWGVANLGWMYYENWLHAPVPKFSLIRFVFNSQGVFFAIALFLDKERDSARFDMETLLDFLQIAIVFFSAFFGLYYVQLLRGQTGPGTEVFMTWIFQVVNITLTLLAGFVALTTQSKRLRTLYGGMTVFLLINAIGSGIADYQQSILDVQTGTWYDLGWTAPFLAAAIWASRWKEQPVETALPTIAFRRKSLTALAVKHVMLALAPLTVLVLLMQLGPEWRILDFLLLGISVTCYAARLGVSEFRKAQTAETVRRDTQAMDSAIDGMAIVNSKGEHLYVNPAFARMMGFESQRSIVGKHWRDVYNPADVTPVEASIRQSLKRSATWFGPLAVHHRDGTVFPMEMAVTLLPEGGVVCVSRDITDRRHAEKARIEAETKYRTLVEQVAAISYIAEIGMHGEWIYVSPQIETMFGFTVDEWLSDSRGWTRHVHPDDHGVIETAEEACTRGERYQAEFRVIRKDGRIIWVSDTAVVVPGSDSHPVMEGVIVDITDRKHLEGQLQQARRMEAVGRARGWNRARFQQFADDHQGLYRTSLDASRRSSRSCARISNASRMLRNARQRWCDNCWLLAGGKCCSRKCST